MRFLREVTSTFNGPRRRASGFDILPVIAFLLPVAFYFWYIARNGVNVPRWDDWEIIPIASGFLHGNLTASMLWSQHNENRMPVAYLFDLIFTRFGNLDFRALMFFSAILIVAAYALLGWSYFRNRRFTWWGLVPVTLIGFSLAQHDNPLWGFQIAWYLVVVCLAVTLYCLISLEEHMRWKLICAMVAAAIGSFSSFQGLLIWPAGLVVLILQEVRRRVVIQWLVVAFAVTVVYFVGFNLGSTGGGSIASALIRPDRLVPFLLVELGSVAAGTDPASPPGYAGLGLFGLLLLALSGAVVFSAWRSRPNAQLALAAALIVFALLFDVFVYAGRGASGIASATTSRYTTYNLLLLLGNYFGLAALVRLSSGIELRRVVGTAGLFVILLLAQVVAATSIGLKVGEAQRIAALQSAAVTLDYLNASPVRIQSYVYPDVVTFRRLSALAQRDNLSLFSGGKKCSTFSGWEPHLSPARSLDGGYAARPRADRSLGLYLKGNRRANEAWRVLSELYGKRPDLAASYPAWGITSPASVLAWAGTANASKYARGALAAYSQEYRAMFDVAKRSLAEGHHSPDLPYLVLPAPAPLTPMLLESDRAAEAWRVLSILYFERQDLVRAFPGSAAEFPKPYLDWAASSSKSQDVDGTGSLLRGYVGELQTMQNIMASSPSEVDKFTPEEILPTPHSLKPLLASDPATYAAWILLSNAYRSDRGFHPVTEAQSECLDLSLARWALGPGLSSEKLFSSYESQIASMRDALQQ